MAHTVWRSRWGHWLAIEEWQGELAAVVHMAGGEPPRALTLTVADTRALSRALSDAADSIAAAMPARCSACGDNVPCADDLCVSCEVALSGARRRSLRVVARDGVAL